MPASVTATDAVDVDEDSHLTRLWTPDGRVFALIHAGRHGLDAERLKLWLDLWLTEARS